MQLYQPTITGSLLVSGSIVATGGITVTNPIASASYANSASYAATAISASYTVNATSASWITGSDVVGVVSNTTSASFAVQAQTASFANTFTVNSTLTAQTLVVQTITSSVDYVTGSTRFGSLIGNTHVFTGSISATGSLTLTSGSDLTIADGNVHMRTTSNGNRGITRYYDTSNIERLQILGNATGAAIYGISGSVQFYTGGSAPAKITLQTDGNLGIGTTTPSTLLNVYTSSATTQSIIAEFYNGDYTSGTKNFIRVRNGVSVGSTMSSYFGQGQDGKTYIISNDFTKNHIVIDGNSTYVGIGSSSPEKQLTVNYGATVLGGLLVTGSQRQETIFRSSGEHCFLYIDSYHNNIFLPKLHLQRSSTTYGVVGLERASSSDPIGSYTESEMIVGSLTATPFSLQTSGSRRIIIGSDGNIGIGKTNPAVSLDMSAKTDALYLAVGTTAQRPTAANGLVRYNTDLQSLETYITNNWVNVQTTANNNYGWRRPSTFNIGGTLADGDRTWYSEINTANNYSAVVLNHVFTGNFTVVATWQRDYMGLGMMYKTGASLLDFNGYSADGFGPYFGGTSVSGFSSGTYNSYSYLGLYAGPAGNGATSGTKYYIKWQRSGNTLTMQYNTSGPWSTWTNFSSGASATCSSGDSVIVGAGEAGTTENDPLRLIYVIGS